MTQPEPEPLSTTNLRDVWAVSMHAALSGLCRSPVVGTSELDFTTTTARIAALVADAALIQYRARFDPSPLLGDQ